MVELSALALSAKKFRPIATEEAFVIPEVLAAAAKLLESVSANEDAAMQAWRLKISGGSAYASDFNRRLLDLGEERLHIMDEHGIAMQLLSLTATGVQQFAPDIASELAIIAN